MRLAALAALVVAATGIVVHQLRVTARELYDAGRITGYAQRALERR